MQGLSKGWVYIHSVNSHRQLVTSVYTRKIPFLCKQVVSTVDPVLLLEGAHPKTCGLQSFYANGKSIQL